MLNAPRVSLRDLTGSMYPKNSPDGREASSIDLYLPGVWPAVWWRRQPTPPRLSSRCAPARGRHCWSPIAKARRWLHELSSHQVTSFGDISAREGWAERYVRSILPLAFLAPDVVKAAIDGRLPDTYGVSRLAANSSLSWDDQRCVLGLRAP